MLSILFAACNTYGFDIPQLTLLVEYQTQQRLHVQITPRYVAPSNYSQYILAPYITGYPGSVAHNGIPPAAVTIRFLLTKCVANDLTFTWTNTPNFQFQVCRTSSGEVLFSTYGTVIVFQNQFLEVITSMVPDYNIYGLAEHITNFRLHNDLNVTFYAADSGNQIGQCLLSLELTAADSVQTPTSMAHIPCISRQDMPTAAHCPMVSTVVMVSYT